MSTLMLELSAPPRVTYNEVRAFADWWERNREKRRRMYWMEALLWWLEPKYPDGVDQVVVLDALEELTWRNLL